jgi:phage major head subunit gpT-like protein
MATASALTNPFAMTGVLTRDNYRDTLSKLFDKVFYRQFKEPIDGMALYSVINSSSDTYNWSTMTGFGLIPKSADENDLPLDQPIQGWDNSMTAVDYRGSVRITERMRETDQHGTISKLQGLLTRAAHKTVAYLTCHPLNTGFDATGEWLCEDRMYLFDSDRPNVDGAAPAWSNLEIGALSATTLAGARVNMRRLKNERDLSISLVPEKLIVSPDNEQNAIELTQSNLAPDQLINNMNFLKGKFTVVVLPDITSTTAWFVQAANDSLNELYWLWRVKPESKTFALGTNPDVTVHRVRFSCQTGCGRPHSIRGSTGT